MKKYFGYTERGSRLAAIWTVVWVVAVGLFAANDWETVRQAATAAGSLSYAEPEGVGWGFRAGLLAGMLIYYMALSEFVRRALRGVACDGRNVRVGLTAGRLLGVVAGGFLLTVVTLGIYGPWFVARLIRCFARGTEFDGERFDFRGEGITLFGIVTVTIMLPVALLTAMLLTLDPLLIGGMMLVLVLAVYLYYALFLKWVVDFGYRGYAISCRLRVLPAAAFLLGQGVLAGLTAGLYAPAAFVRVWRYCVRRTTAVGEGDRTLRMGCDLRMSEDYLYLLGQSLLVAVTLGIYTPWALERSARRVLGKTWVETVE